MKITMEKIFTLLCISFKRSFQMAKIAMIGINDKKINTYSRRPEKQTRKINRSQIAKPCKWQFPGFNRFVVLN